MSDKFTPRVLRNDRSNATITTTMSDREAFERYIGCFLRGVFRVARERRAVLEEGTETIYYRGRRRYQQTRYEDGPEVVPNAVEREFLARLKEDPVKFLAECGRDMDRCCYCGLPLEDQRSKEAGYGPVCAGRWGLPWGGKGSGDDAVKTFGEVYSPECHFFAAACRAKIDDQLAWDMWSDWLTEQGAVRERKNRKGEVVRGFERPTGRFLYPRWDGPTPRRPERKVAQEPAPVAPPAPVQETPRGVDPNDVPSGRLEWTAANKMLRGTISGLGWESIPGTIVVRSEKTGNTRTFRESCRDVVRGEVKAIHYRSPDGIKLVIAND